MTLYRLTLAAIVLTLTFSSSAFSQRVGYINSSTIREKFPEARQAEQRLESIVNDWKRDLAEQLRVIEALDEEIRKNRLIWTDKERQEKEKDLLDKKSARERFANQKFSPGGEYDQTIPVITRGVEEKIYAAVQEVCFEESFDIVWDKSTQPLAFINPKYDLTVKVMKKLGVDVEKLEEQMQQAIDTDPRNKKKPEDSRPTTRRRRSRSGDDEETTPSATETETLKKPATESSPDSEIKPD